MPLQTRNHSRASKLLFLSFSLLFFFFLFSRFFVFRHLSPHSLSDDRPWDAKRFGVARSLTSQLNRDFAGRKKTSRTNSLQRDWTCIVENKCIHSKSFKCFYNKCPIKYCFQKKIWNLLKCLLLKQVKHILLDCSRDRMSESRYNNTKDGGCRFERYKTYPSPLTYTLACSSLTRWNMREREGMKERGKEREQEREGNICGSDKQLRARVFLVRKGCHTK